MRRIFLLAEGEHLFRDTFAVGLLQGGVQLKALLACSGMPASISQKDATARGSKPGRICWSARFGASTKLERNFNR